MQSEDYAPLCLELSMDVTSNPWTVLNLKLGERDRRAIRRAYAAAVRAHPPDGDPTAFRRVRDAYELLDRGDPELLDLLERDLAAELEAAGDSGSGLIPGALADTQETSGQGAPEWLDDQLLERDGHSHGGSASQTPHEPNTVAAAEAWSDRFHERLLAANALEEEERKYAVRSALDEAWSESDGDWARRKALTEILEGRFARKQQGAIAASASRRTVMDSYLSGDHELLCWILSALARAGRNRMLGGLASLVLERSAERTDPASAEHLLDFAELLAIPLPATAEQMLDAAYAHASPASRRRWDQSHFEALLRVGREIRFWKPQARALLSWIAAAGAIPAQASLETFEPVADSLIAVKKAPLTKALLASVAPELLRRSRAISREQRRRVRRRLDERDEQAGRRMEFWFGLAFAVIVVVCWRSCRDALTGRDPASRRGADHVEDMQRRLRELREERRQITPPRAPDSRTR